MSSLPPVSTPDGGTLPWEQRPRLDPVHAFVETVKLFVTRPDEAWRMTPERGGFESPLLFGLIVSFLGAAVSFVYRWIFVSPWVRMFPGAMYRRWGWAMGRRPAGCAIVAWPFGAAFGILIGLFIVTAILHLFVLIVGAARGSASGFEGSFRVVSYSAISSLAQVIPIFGGLIAFVWWIVLAVKGVVRMHRTTPGRALAAVLVPMALVVGLVVLCLVVVFGLLLATHRGSSYSL
jgi:hypothetical protein